MSLSQKDAVNPYLVNTGVPHCIPWNLLRKTSAKKTSAKKTNSESIKELEEKNSELESLLSEKTKSYNDELVKWNKREKELESTIEKFALSQLIFITDIVDSLKDKEVYLFSDKDFRHYVDFHNAIRILKNRMYRKFDSMPEYLALKPNIDSLEEKVDEYSRLIYDKYYEAIETLNLDIEKKDVYQDHNLQHELYAAKTHVDNYIQLGKYLRFDQKRITEAVINLQKIVALINNFATPKKFVK